MLVMSSGLAFQVLISKATPPPFFKWPLNFFLILQVDYRKKIRNTDEQKQLKNVKRTQNQTFQV